MGRAFEYRRAAKEKRWGQMSRVFPKLAKAITLAAKEGGGDPEMNPKLRTAIQNAKAQNMPKDNIDKAIKRATSKDMADYQEVNYEGKGPHGVLVYVETATDNPTRTVADMRFIFSRNGGQVVPNGQLEFMFNRKAVVQFPKTEDMDLEELELGLIDGGLESLEVHEDEVYAYADYTDFGNLTQAFEDMGIEYTKATLQRVPTSPIQLTDEQMEEVDELVDKLEENDDVQQVFTNIE